MFHPATPSESRGKRLFPALPNQAAEPSAKPLPLPCQPYEEILSWIARSETLPQVLATNPGPESWPAGCNVHVHETYTPRFSTLSKRSSIMGARHGSLGTDG